MKNLFGLLFVCTLFVMTSCGGGEKCATDFAGTYTGTESCDVLGTVSTGAITEIVIAGTDGDYTIGGVKADQDDCTLSIDNTVFGIGSKTTVTINGSTITLVKDNVGIEVCTFTGTK